MWWRKQSKKGFYYTHDMERIERSFWSMIKRFFEPIKTTPKSYAFFIFSEAFDVFQSIFVVQLWFYIIRAIESWHEEKILFRWMILWWLFVVTRLITYISQIVYEYLMNQSEFDIKKKYLKKLISLDNNAIDRLGTGKIQDIIKTWIDSWWNMATWILGSITVESLWLIYAFVIMLNESPTIYHFVWLVVLFIVSSYFLWKWLYILEWVRRQSKEIGTEIARHDVKIIMSKVEILQNNKIGHELSKQQSLISKNINLRQRWNAIKWLRQMMSWFLIDWLQLRIYVWVWLWVLTWNYTFAYMMLLLQLVNKVDQYVWQLRGHFKRYFAEKTHIEKLWDLFDTTPTITWYEEWADFEYTRWKIQIKNITYAYDAENVFSDFSLDLHWWKKTALVWVSWSWKSTLVKLIAWYLRPDSGGIIVDGQNLADVSLKSYYKHIGYLTQEPSVFDGTVMENLTYALEADVDTWVLQQAIKNARCEFVNEFPQGLETEIGEKWIRLSGGQRQRLAIAKIFLKDPKIIILDEPTSSLDSFSEEWITEAMHNLFAGRTVIIIAHRLQTVKEADDIILLDNGKVMERWTHTELVNLWGQYAKMLELQSWF